MSKPSSTTRRPGTPTLGPSGLLPLLSALFVALAASSSSAQTLRFSSSNASLDEESMLSVQIQRSGSAVATGVDVEAAGGSAVEPDDFQVLTSGGPCDREVCFESGQNQIFIDVVGGTDDLAEGTEHFVLQLQNPAPGAVIGSPSTLQVLLFDVGACGLAMNPITVLESAEVLTVVVAREGGTASGIDCMFATFPSETGSIASTPGDYEAVSTVLSWESGDGTSRAVEIPIVNDDDLEEDETFGIGVSRLFPGVKVPPAAATYRDSGTARSSTTSDLPSAAAAAHWTFALGLTSATVVIEDDELSSLFSFDRERLDVDEADGSIEFQILRRRHVEKAAAIDVQVINDTAAEGLDFSLPVKTLTWGPGDDEPKTVRVDIVHDALDEPTEEAFLSLSNPRETPPGGGQPATEAPFFIKLRIGNLPLQGQVRFTSQLFGAFEGDPPLQGAATALPNAQVLVERVASGQGAAAVRVCLGDESSAEAADFALPASTVLAWGSGELGVRALPIEILDDQEIEGTELLELRLCDVSFGVELGEPAGAFLVLGDDDFEVSEPTEIAAASTEPEHPVVVYDRFGGKIVVWQAEDGDGFGIFARRYDDDDQPLGPAFRVNSATGGNQTDPSVSFDEAGGFVVTYREEEGDFAISPSGRVIARSVQGSSVVARAFNPGGQPQGNGTIVSTGAADASEQPEVSRDKDGESTITWLDGGKPKARVLDSQNRPRTGAFDVGETDDACEPEVATSASGDFVVVWVENGCAGGNANGTVRARLFADDSQPKTGEITVATGAGISWAAVGMDEAGNFAVVWQAQGQSGLDVFARLYDADGEPRGAAFRVNQQTTGDQTRPRVDANSVFDLAVVWESNAAQPGSAAEGSSVVARVFNPQGQPQSGDVVTVTSEAETDVANPDVSIENKDDVTVVWEKRGSGGEPKGIDSTVIKTSLPDGTCDSGDETLCLADSRFEVTVAWQSVGNSGSGQAVPLTSDTGYAWFFDVENVEVIVKVLDGCAINGRFWVFAAGLTNIEVNLQVDDVVSGDTVSYFNSLGESFQPILDTDAFASCTLDTAPVRSPEAAFAALERGLRDLTAAAAALRGPEGSSRLRSGAAAACASDANTLCLNDSRYEVEIDWRSADDSGQGSAVPLTSDSGTFWFFDEDNVEAIVKVLDACVINDHVWVFAAGLTDVETLLTVNDSEQPRSRSYQSTLGVPFPPILDVEAFPCP